MKRLNKLSCLALVAAAAAFVPQIASAASIQYNDSVSPTSTDWSDSVSLTQFDSSLGTLNSITILLDGHVAGTAQFEHTGTQLPASHITTNLQSQISVLAPDLSTLVTVLPVASNTATNVPTYDGTTDYDGTSGHTYDNLSASDSDSFVSSNAAMLALFTGTGSITLPVTAEGQSLATGTGNVSTQFVNTAAADVTVIYDYTPASVPVPAAAPAGVALLGLLGLRRWKKSLAQ